jgi:hypothetical protein
MAINGDVSAVNSTYRAAVHRQLQEAGGRVSMGALFDAWFANWVRADDVKSSESIAAE